MMELDIMMQGAPAGKLQMEQDGLFLYFRCTLRSAPEAPLRLYAISGWHSEYLGIPYPQNGTAQLEARLPASHFPQLPEYAVADTQPRAHGSRGAAGSTAFPSGSAVCAPAAMVWRLRCRRRRRSCFPPGFRT